MPPTPAAIFKAFQDANVIATEGHCSLPQVEFFLDFLKDHPEVKTIFEIGFNAGHSSYTFLSARPDITVVSLDLGAHDYVIKGKELIDKTFPNRHTLIIGDSTKAFPGPTATLLKAYAPDLYFIDGGHDDPIPEKDIRNCLATAKPGCWFIVDDVIEHHVGVLKAVRQLIGEGKLASMAVYKDAPNHRGWFLGKPLF